MHNAFALSTAQQIARRQTLHARHVNLETPTGKLLKAQMGLPFQEHSRFAPLAGAVFAAGVFGFASGPAGAEVRIGNTAVGAYSAEAAYAAGSVVSRTDVVGSRSKTVQVGGAGHKQMYDAQRYARLAQAERRLYGGTLSQMTYHSMGVAGWEERVRMLDQWLANVGPAGTPTIGLQMTGAGDPRKVFSGQNPEMQALADVFRKAQARGHQVNLRYLSEFNLTSSPYSLASRKVSLEGFQGGARQLRHLLPDNVRLVFDPEIAAAHHSPTNMAIVRRAWDGSAFDLVGGTLYATQKETLGQVYDGYYREMRQLAPNRRFMISELGAPLADAQKTRAWFQAVREGQYPGLERVVLFAAPLNTVKEERLGQYGFTARSGGESFLKGMLTPVEPVAVAPAAHAQEALRRSRTRVPFRLPSLPPAGKAAGVVLVGVGVAGALAARRRRQGRSAGSTTPTAAPPPTAPPPAAALETALTPAFERPPSPAFTLQPPETPAAQGPFLVGEPVTTQVTPTGKVVPPGVVPVSEIQLPPRQVNPVTAAAPLPAAARTPHAFIPASALSRYVRPGFVPVSEIQLPQRKWTLLPGGQLALFDSPARTLPPSSPVGAALKTEVLTSGQLSLNFISGHSPALPALPDRAGPSRWHHPALTNSAGQLSFGFPVTLRASTPSGLPAAASRSSVGQLALNFAAESASRGPFGFIPASALSRYVRPGFVPLNEVGLPLRQLSVVPAPMQAKEWIAGNPDFHAAWNRLEKGNPDFQALMREILDMPEVADEVISKQTHMVLGELLREGKSVPPEVLKGYLGLAPASAPGLKAAARTPHAFIPASAVTRYVRPGFVPVSAIESRVARPAAASSPIVEPAASAAVAASQPAPAAAVSTSPAQAAARPAAAPPAPESGEAPRFRPGTVRNLAIAGGVVVGGLLLGGKLLMDMLDGDGRRAYAGSSTPSLDRGRTEHQETQHTRQQSAAGAPRVTTQVHLQDAPLDMAVVDRLYSNHLAYGHAFS